MIDGEKKREKKMLNEWMLDWLIGGSNLHFSPCSYGGVVESSFLRVLVLINIVKTEGVSVGIELYFCPLTTWTDRNKYKKLKISTSKRDIDYIFSWSRAVSRYMLHISPNQTPIFDSRFYRTNIKKFIAQLSKIKKIKIYIYK